MHFLTLVVNCHANHHKQIEISIILLDSFNIFGAEAQEFAEFRI